MKYEKPEVVLLAPALDAIQCGKQAGQPENQKDASPSYEDWE